MRNRLVTSLRAAATRSVLAAAFVAGCVALVPPDGAGAQKKRVKGNSKTPPVGAPWMRDFGEARAAALKAGKPIFLYSTKTY